MPFFELVKAQPLLYYPAEIYFDLIRGSTVKTALKLLCVVALASLWGGCGIDWFPAVTQSPNTPNGFTFTSKIGVPVQGNISSNAIVVSGFANNSTAASVSVSSGSAFSVNGVRATGLTGTVKNNDTVKVFQTAASQLGTTQVTNINIGTRPGTFTTVTQTINTPSFSQTTVQPANFTQITTGPLTALDPGHTIKMSGTGTLFSVTDASNNNVIAFTSSAATFNVSNLASHHLLLQIPTGTTGTTSLTVDATTYVIDNITPFGVKSLPQ